MEKEVPFREGKSAQKEISLPVASFPFSSDFHGLSNLWTSVFPRGMTLYESMEFAV